jgi:hypothetical protein
MAQIRKRIVMRAAACSPCALRFAREKPLRAAPVCLTRGARVSYAIHTTRASASRPTAGREGRRARPHLLDYGGRPRRRRVLEARGERVLEVAWRGDGGGAYGHGHRRRSRRALGARGDEGGKGRGTYGASFRHGTPVATTSLMRRLIVTDWRAQMGDTVSQS